MAHVREYGTSVDFMGAVWTDPQQYSRVVPKDTFPITIAELVGVGGVARLSRLSQGLLTQGVRPVQVHGATGYSGKEPWYDGLKVRSIGKFIPGPNDLEAQLSDLDIVMHAPAVRRFLHDGARRQFSFTAHPRWLVENHDPGLGGVTEALSLAGRVRDRGIPAGVIVDVGHVTRRLSGKAFDTVWTALTRYLHVMSHTPGGIMGVHIPEGTLRDDSLPEWVSKSQRTDLAASLGPAVERVIFEYQRGKPHGLVHLFSREEKKERARMTGIFDKWAEAGLFNSAGVK